MEPLFEQLKEKAIANKQRIVLPESLEPRTLKAADKIVEDNIASITLIGNRDQILAKATELGLSHIGKCTFVDPDDSSTLERYATLLAEIRKSKGMTIEQARQVAKDPLYLGCLIIKSGEADGQVAGAIHATGDVLRAAFQVIKTLPGIKSVSGAFIMMLPEGTPLADRGVMIFADCAVIPSPDAQQLAEIAVLANETAKGLGNIAEPKVAMLSFSTKGSAKHENVDKVVEATKLAREMNPNLHVDGELQLDAALIPSVGQQKAPGSNIAGNANVLVFPDLQSGNIGYKLVQRFAGATAAGPVLQGLAEPVNDLSRGCSADDIFKTILLTCNQAIHKKSQH